MSRSRYFVIRTLQTVFMMWALLTFLFFLFRAMPGSFVDIMMAEGANPEAIAQFEKKWNLNDPLYIQYWKYLVNFITLDVGTSIQFGANIWTYTRMKIFNTLILAIPAITTAYALATLIGSYMGTNRGSRSEKFGVISLTTLSSFPAFVLGIFVVIIFALKLNFFPSSGMIPPEVSLRFEDAPWWRPYLTTAFFSHYILPFSVIIFRFLMGPTMIMRTSVVEVLGQDFIYYQEVSGLPTSNRLRHITKHSIIPVLTLYPIQLAQAISGLVVLELIFNWPGIGHALVQAVLARDFPVAQFVFFVSASLVIISNFLVDIAYGIIDPRISVEGEGEAAN